MNIFFIFLLFCIVMVWSWPEPVIFAKKLCTFHPSPSRISKKQSPSEICYSASWTTHKALYYPYVIYLHVRKFLICSLRYAWWCLKVLPDCLVYSYEAFSSSSEDLQETYFEIRRRSTVCNSILLNVAEKVF